MVKYNGKQMKSVVGESCILPDDEELQNREKCWINLFEKYSIDEESDTELIDDDYISKTAHEDAIEEKDFDVVHESAFSCDEDEDDDFELEKIASQLKPLVEERIAAWPKKGVKLLLKTVDPSVTVEEWIQANSECTTTTTTTTTKVETSVIHMHNKTVTKSNNRTTTTTTKQTIQIKISPQAQVVQYNHRQQLRKIKKTVKDTLSAQIKSSQPTDKNRSKAKILKQKKLKNPIENSVEQQRSVMRPPGKPVATSNKIGKKLQATSKVMPHRNEAQSTVLVQELSKMSLRSRGHRNVKAIQSKQIKNLSETTRQRNGNRKPPDTEHAQNEGRDSITQLPSSTAKMKQCYVRLSNEILPANTESPSACDSEDEDVLQSPFRSIARSLETSPRQAKLFRSSMSIDNSGFEEDDILSTNYAKLIQNGEIF